MNYCYVLKTNNTYFAGWIPVLDDDEPEFCSDLIHASLFDYGQAQYMQEILEVNHHLKMDIRKIGEI